MHQETLLYMLQQLPPEKKRRPTCFSRYFFQRARRGRKILIPRGRARLGAKFDETLFGWDNEFEEMCVDVPAFTIDSLPVTNGEFFEFVVCRWLRKADLLASGRLALEEPGDEISCPTFWLKHGGHGFIARCSILCRWPRSQLAGLRESCGSASLCRWLASGLPTEAEFHRAAYYGPDGRESDYPWGNTTADGAARQFRFFSWSPLPVGSRPAGASRWGVQELAGNGWELTDTPFAPFPRFTPYMASYPDYSRTFSTANTLS